MFNIIRDPVVNSNVLRLINDDLMVNRNVLRLITNDFIFNLSGIVTKFKGLAIP